MTEEIFEQLESDGGLVYHNPIGEPYNETRTDIEASISGNSADNLIITEVINFKKLYPGWILDSLKNVGRVDILPPETVYKYTFKTPQGHYWSMGGIESIR
jgi:hypothetical protein